jgi:hypothetical protein
MSQEGDCIIQSFDIDNPVLGYGAILERPTTPDSLYFFALSFSLLKDPNEVPSAGRLEIAWNDVAEVSKPIVPVPIVVPAVAIKIWWATFEEISFRRS